MSNCILNSSTQESHHHPKFSTLKLNSPSSPLPELSVLEKGIVTYPVVQTRNRPLLISLIQPRAKSCWLYLLPLLPIYTTCSLVQATTISCINYCDNLLISLSTIPLLLPPSIFSPQSLSHNLLKIANLIMSYSCFKTLSMAPQCSMTKVQAPDYHLLLPSALLLGPLPASLLTSNHSPRLHHRGLFSNS